MNILETQDKLKGLSQDQLMAEMKMPTGQAPQFLVLSEITRRQKMQESFSLEQGKDETTVAQDAVAAAGMPGQFAGDMAGTMAPQTDMDGNTGAMPQQAMPPQGSPAPQTMSGGGIVSLQEGGPVGGDISSLMTDPTIQTMANRAGMSIQEYFDSLAPEAQAQHLRRVERSSMMALEPTVAGTPLAVNPSSAESTQDTFRAGDAFEDERAGYIQDLLRESSGPEPFDMQTLAGRGVQPKAPEFDARSAPNLPNRLLSGQRGEGASAMNDFPRVPSALNAPNPTSGQPFSIEQPPNRSYPSPRGPVNNDRPVAMPTPSPHGPSPVGAIDTGAFGETLGRWGDSARDATDLTASSITAIGDYDPNRELGQSGGAFGDLGYLAQLGVGAISKAPGVAGAGLGYLAGQTGDLAVTTAEIVNNLVDPYTNYVAGVTANPNDGPSAMEEAATAPQANTGAGLAELGPTVSAAAAQESAPDAGMDMGTALSGVVMPPVGGAPAQSQGSRAAPSGGGIASMAAQGGGAPSDYEQELIKMLNAREKRAEQDKWMALAEAGMALMSSSQPTFGGALGEAGQAGLGALRAGTESAETDRLGMLGAIEQSRLGREQLQMQRQAAAARAASGRSSGSGGDDEGPIGDITAGQGRTVAQHNADIEFYRESLSGAYGPVNPGDRVTLTSALNTSVGRRNALLTAGSGTPFGGAVPVGQIDLDLTAP